MQVIIPPKAKADFAMWFCKKYEPKMLEGATSPDGAYGANETAEAAAYIFEWSFLCLPFAMQQGVYQAYLQEKGVFTEARPGIFTGNDKTHWYWPLLNGDVVDSPIEQMDFSTALAAAITSAFERIEETL